MDSDGTKQIDCLIIGGGPAGLTAAIYLARFRRNALLFDNNSSRASLIPVSHNYPGFTEGVSGQQLLNILRKQAEHYGAILREAQVNQLRKNEMGKFIALADGKEIKASTVLMTTGIVDEKPSLPGMPQFIYSGIVRFCPICDGYETMDKRVGVIGPLNHIIPKTLFLRTYTWDLVMLATDKDIQCSDHDIEKLHAAGLRPPAEPVADVVMSGERLTAVMASGAQIELDILYPAMGAHARSELATGLGAKTDNSGCLVTDSHQCTSVPGLYAAGDVTLDLSQISVATGQAAIAATAIHNILPPNPRRVIP
jgi:thioredoxin reductase (NADPH)